MKLTYKRIISPWQSNYFDNEHTDIFVVYLNFYKSTGSANWCPVGEGWGCSTAASIPGCGHATFSHRRHTHFSPCFCSINRAHFHLHFWMNLVLSSVQDYCFFRVGSFLHWACANYVRVELGKGAANYVRAELGKGASLRRGNFMFKKTQRNKWRLNTRRRCSVDTMSSPVPWVTTRFA